MPYFPHRDHVLALLTFIGDRQFEFGKKYPWLPSALAFTTFIT